jgi:hypothetical protein
MRIEERRPAVVPGHIDHIAIVHCGPSERFVCQREAARSDQIDCDTEAGGEPEICPKILGDVRLIESESHFRRVRHLRGLSCDIPPRGGFPTGRS